MVLFTMCIVSIYFIGTYILYGTGNVNVIQPINETDLVIKSISEICEY